MFPGIFLAQAHSSNCVESFAKTLIQEYTALKRPTETKTKETELLLHRSHAKSAEEADARALAAEAGGDVQQPPPPREEVIAVAQKLASGMHVPEETLHPHIRSAVSALGGSAAAAAASSLPSLQEWEPWWTRGNLQAQPQTHTPTALTAADARGNSPEEDMVHQLRSAVQAQLQAEHVANEPPLWDSTLLHVPPLHTLLPPAVQPHASVAYQLVALLLAYAYAVRRVGGQVAAQEELVACDLLQCAPSMHDATLPPIPSVRSACDGFLGEALAGEAISEAAATRAMALASCGDAPLLLRSGATCMRAVAHVHSLLGCVAGMPVDKRGRRRLLGAQRKTLFLLAWLQQMNTSGQHGSQRLDDLAAACDMVQRALTEMHGTSMHGPT